MEKEWCHVTLISVTSSLWTRVGNNVIFIGSVAKYIYRHQYLLGNQFVLIIGLVVVVVGGLWRQRGTMEFYVKLMNIFIDSNRTNIIRGFDLGTSAAFGYFYYASSPLAECYLFFDKRVRFEIIIYLLSTIMKISSGQWTC